MNVEEYSNSEILNLFYIHGECHKIISRTCRLFNERYPNSPSMTFKKFRRIERNFLQFGQIRKEIMKTKPITKDEGTEINVLTYFHINPRSSIGSAALDLNISWSSVQRILHSHKMHPYSFIRLQSLYAGDNMRRIEFCEQILVALQENPNFLTTIIWTDESKFSREGMYNRKNWHYWADENPHCIRQADFQHTFSFNVFCLVMNDRVIFKIYDGNLNGEKYLDLLRGCVTQFIDNLPLEIWRKCWYQMDGAPAHCTYEVDRQLTLMFEDRWMGRNGPWRWPARSPDLTPVDFYLWGTIKNKVYFTPVNSRDELRERVIAAFQQLRPNEIRKATTTEVKRRILCCLNQNGGHVEHL